MALWTDLLPLGAAIEIGLILLEAQQTRRYRQRLNRLLADENC